MTAITGSNTEKLDILLQRTAVLETVAKTVEQHDCVLYGPNHDDGMVTEMSDLKTAVSGLKGTIKKTIWSIGAPILIMVVGLFLGFFTKFLVLSINITPR
jgi:hypothetical protein